MPRTPRANPSPTPIGGATADRLVVVDALRCLAVLLVLGRHIGPAIAAPDAEPNAVFAAWRSFGWIGVDLFFVLSGFLVSGLLFREHERHGAIRPWHFLGRRGFKIYPGFYALLLVSVVWLGGRVPADAFVHEALFVQNYLDPVVWNHTWSLAVEEHFYLLLAFAMAFATRRGGGEALRGLPTVVATVCVVCLAWRVTTWLRAPGGHLLFATHLRLDALAFGTGLAYAWHAHREPLLAWIARHRQRLAVASVLLLAPSVLLPVEGSMVVNTVGLTTNYLAFGGILLLCLTSSRRLDRFPVRALARLGAASYSIYLWHMPVAKVVRWWVEPTIGHAPAVAVYVVGSLVVGIGMATILERPFLRWRERWLPSRSAMARNAVTTPVVEHPPAPTTVADRELEPVGR